MHASPPIPPPHACHKWPSSHAHPHGMHAPTMHPPAMHVPHTHMPHPPPPHHAHPSFTTHAPPTPAPPRTPLLHHTCPRPHHAHPSFTTHAPPEGGGQFKVNSKFPLLLAKWNFTSGLLVGAGGAGRRRYKVRRVCSDRCPSKEAWSDQNLSDLHLGWRK